MTRVIIDEREKSTVPTHLKRMGLTIDYRMLGEGDYLIDGYAVERKSTHDFFSSLYSGRLFDQAYRLSQSRFFPVMIVEGDLYSTLEETRNPKVFWGALISLSFQYGVRILFTRNPEETAELIWILAKHPPKLQSKPPIIVRKPRGALIREGQIALVQGLPGVGPRLAEQLLRRFKTPRKVFMATEAELCFRGGLGRSKAAKITSLLDTDHTKLEVNFEQLRLTSIEPQP
ncbi:MAG: ERCC4 domain-containing protein [Candidatus Bathyarchaeia archaeon]